MKIKMKALDTLFFRDGKPFSKGEESWSDGIFPPFPSVFYGALRTAYFSNNIEEFRKLNENDFNKEQDLSSKLKINSINLLDSSNIMFPFPKDCLCIKEKNEKGQSNPVRITSFKSKGSSSSKTPFILKTDEKIYEPVDFGFLSDIDFYSYLSSKDSTFDNINLKNKIINEPKVGNGRDFFTRTAEDSQLYRVDMKRLDNLEIVIDFEGFDLPENGFLKLGGEGKAVYYEKYDTDLNITLPQIEKCFVMYLSTPSIFENGWLPKSINPETLRGNIGDLKVKLLSAVIDRPLNIGGFDMAKREPKPMKKAVPAGSVYFFEIVEGNASDLTEHQGKSISDDKKEEGFGIAYFGKTEMELIK